MINNDDIWRITRKCRLHKECIVWLKDIQTHNSNKVALLPKNTGHLQNFCVHGKSDTRIHLKYNFIDVLQYLIKRWIFYSFSHFLFLCIISFKYYLQKNCDEYYQSGDHINTIIMNYLSISPWFKVIMFNV